ncbi:DUF1405 domain-containing protein [Moorella naiadis]|uniref:DUF1405 domain-containing protein n=1 Tax=Moorella naiadis (nom. illeg.) TaxID=3093670 RepID=UPI003D9C89DD
MGIATGSGQHFRQNFYFWLRHLLWEDPYQDWFLVTLLVINLLGSIYGYYWYHEQLLATPWFWWPFTPDSPLATTLFTLALFLALGRWESGLLRLVAAVAVMKYGLWAIVIITDFWRAGAAVTPVEAGLWLSHLGMLAEGYLFLRHWPAVPWQLGVIALWLIINDSVDYGLGLHPYLFRPDQEGLALVTATAISLAAILYLVWRIKWPSRAGKSAAGNE